MKKNHYLGLLAGVLTAGVLQGSDGKEKMLGVGEKQTSKQETNTTRQGPKGKHLDPFNMQVVSKYLKSRDDLLNVAQVNSKYKELPNRNRTNYIPITAKNQNLFQFIETQQIFGPKDYIIPGLYKHVITYPVDEYEIDEWMDQLNDENVVFDYVKTNAKAIESGRIEQEYDCTIEHYICDHVDYLEYLQLKEKHGNKIIFAKVDNVYNFYINDMQEDPKVMQFITHEGTLKALSIPKVPYVVTLVSKFAIPNGNVLCTWEYLFGESLHNSTCENFYAINLESVHAYDSRLYGEFNKFTANVGYFPFISKEYDQILRISKTSNFQKLYVPYYYDNSDDLIWMGGDKCRYPTKHIEGTNVLYTENATGDEMIYIMDDESERKKLSPERLKAINEKIEEIMANSIEVVFYTEAQIQAIKQQRVLFYNFIKFYGLEKYMQYINLEKPKNVFKRDLDQNGVMLAKFRDLNVKRFDSMAEIEEISQYEWDNYVLPIKAEVEKLMAVMRCEQAPEEKIHTSNAVDELMAAAINISLDNEEMIANELATRGLQIQNVTGDGNCGIYALLAGLNPKQAENYSHVIQSTEEGTPWRNAETLRQTLLGNDNALGQMVDNLENPEQLNRWLALDNPQALQAVNNYVRNQGRSSLIVLDTTVTAESGVAFTVIDANGEQIRYNMLNEALEAGGNNPLMLVYTPNHWKAVVPSNK